MGINIQKKELFNLAINITLTQAAGKYYSKEDIKKRAKENYNLIKDLSETIDQEDE